MNEILLAKAEIVERALMRVATTYAAHAANLGKNHDAQDVIVLNLQRACEAIIDMAMHLVRLNRLGLPKDSAEAFTLLESAGIIPPLLAEHMRKMVGFRNIAVHDYRELDWTILKSIITRDLADVSEFSAQVIRRFGNE